MDMAKTEDDLKALTWTNWVAVYTTIQGMLMQGYLGRVAENWKTREGHVIELFEPIEYISTVQGGDGSVVRTSNGAPVEFNQHITRIFVVPLAVIELGVLPPEGLKGFGRARLEAADMVDQLRNGPRRIVPGPGKSRLVGL